MAQIREIKKRMVAVGTIQRITKTMQMIANAKFAAALKRTRASKPFTETIRRLVGEVAAAADDVDHPLLRGPAERVGRELLLVIGSDRGMCGAYNGNVLRRAYAYYRQVEATGSTIDLETSGKKLISFFRFQKIEMAEKHVVGDKPEYDAVEQIAHRYLEAFAAGRYDAVRVAYMRFESSSRQIPEVRQLLPMKPEAAGDAEGAGPSPNYEFSPSSDELLAKLLPLAVKAQLFQAFIDAAVSEQIMRMVAMKAATENAKDLGKTLNRDFNRARQTQITTELSEIIGGTAALE